MKTQHEVGDRYVLQGFYKGKWVTDENTTKAGGAQRARAAAKAAGVSYRVFNVSKNVVYCEVRPPKT